MEAWQVRTEHLKERIAALYDILNLLTVPIAKLPSSPLSFALSDKGALKYQLCILTIGAARSAQELKSSTYLLWVLGRFLTASICVRLLIELWGMLAYAESKVMKKMEEPDGLSIASERMKKLMLGSKSGVPLPAGIQGTYPIINVIEFIRAAEQLSTGVEEEYAFLCDASHPTYAQHSYLIFSGSEYDNWSNKKFGENAQLILERTVSAAELAVRGVVDAGVRIFDGCLPQILDEQRAIR
jgi:hypothetical protein